MDPLQGNFTRTGQVIHSNAWWEDWLPLLLLWWTQCTIIARCLLSTEVLRKRTGMAQLMYYWCQRKCHGSKQISPMPAIWVWVNERQNKQQEQKKKKAVCPYKQTSYWCGISKPAKVLMYSEMSSVKSVAHLDSQPRLSLRREIDWQGKDLWQPIDTHPLEQHIYSSRCFPFFLSPC